MTLKSLAKREIAKLKKQEGKESLKKHPFN